METSASPDATPAERPGPMTLSIWLPAGIADVVRRHVPNRRGARSEWGKVAVEAQLRREGAFDGEQSDRAVALLKALPTDQLPLVVLFAELLAVRKDDVAAALAQIKDQALETVGAK